jgi:hypothetical protein
LESAAARFISVEARVRIETDGRSNVFMFIAGRIQRDFTLERKTFFRSAGWLLPPISRSGLPGRGDWVNNDRLMADQKKNLKRFSRPPKDKLESKLGFAMMINLNTNAMPLRAPGDGAGAGCLASH